MTLRRYGSDRDYTALRGLAVLTILVKLPTYEFPTALSSRNAKEDERVAKIARRGDYSEGETVV